MYFCDVHTLCSLAMAQKRTFRCILDVPILLNVLRCSTQNCDALQKILKTKRPKDNHIHEVSNGCRIFADEIEKAVYNPYANLSQKNIDTCLEMLKTGFGKFIEQKKALISWEMRRKHAHRSLTDLCQQRKRLYMMIPNQCYKEDLLKNEK